MGCDASLLIVDEFYCSLYNLNHEMSQTYEKPCGEVEVTLTVKI